MFLFNETNKYLYMLFFVLHKTLQRHLILGAFIMLPNSGWMENQKIVVDNIYINTQAAATATKAKLFLF